MLGRTQCAQVPDSPGKWSASSRVGLFTLGALLLGLTCWASWPAVVTGDGMEYISVSEAFLRHASPDVRAADGESLLHSSASAAPLTTLTHNLLAAIGGNGPLWRQGFFPARNGHLYGYHFWLYSLVNAPALALCEVAGWAPDESFLLTNAACLLGLLALIAFTTRWRACRKALLIALALACGSSFYLAWSGPETMCFCLLVAGLILLEKHRYGWALLAFAAAAQQAPPIGFLAILTGVLACWRAGVAWRAQGWNVTIAKRLAVLMPGALMLIASPVFYVLLFGVPNLIVKSGGSDLALISWSRLAGLFFDLNQGMVLAMPGLFVVLIILLVIGLCRAARRPAWIALGLIAITLLMAVPALTGPNWNAGEVVIMRYAYWLSAPLLYACALLLDALAGIDALIVCVIVLAASQITVMALFGITGARFSYVQMNPIAQWVLDHHPSWYAPAPEIFAERGLHREGRLQAGYSFFYVYQDSINVVLTQGAHETAVDSLCHIDRSKAQPAQTELHWRYLYPQHRCPLDWPDGIYALPDSPPLLKPSVPNSLGGDAGYVSNFLSGFPHMEQWGNWTQERFAVLPLSLPAKVAARPVSRWWITVTFVLYLHPPQISMQHVMLAVGGSQVLDLRMTVGQRTARSFVVNLIPGENNKELMLLTLQIPTAISPSEAGYAKDGRRMGIGLISLRADPL